MVMVMYFGVFVLDTLVPVHIHYCYCRGCSSFGCMYPGDGAREVVWCCSVLSCHTFDLVFRLDLYMLFSQFLCECIVSSPLIVII